MKKIIINLFGISLMGVTGYYLLKMLKDYFTKEKIASLTSSNTSINETPMSTVVTSDKAYNNVGNIRHSKIKYQGEIDSPSQNFKSFSSLAFGYRAMIQLLRAYEKNAFNTLEKIMNRYAPSSDNNNTEAYIIYLEEMTGVNRRENLSTYLYTPEIMKLIASMSKFEQGVMFPLDVPSIRAAYSMTT